MTIDIQSYRMFINFKISVTLSWTLAKQHHLWITGEVILHKFFSCFFFDLKLHESQPLQEHWNPPEVRIKCTEILMLGIAFQKSFLS